MLRYHVMSHHGILHDVPGLHITLGQGGTQCKSVVHNIVLTNFITLTAMQEVMKSLNLEGHQAAILRRQIIHYTLIRKRYDGLLNQSHTTLVYSQWASIQ